MTLEEENEEIFKKLNLNLIIKDKDKFHNFMNDETSNSIFETCKNSCKIANKVFDGMDNGALQPLTIKLFDVLEDKINPFETNKNQDFNIFDKIIEQSKEFLKYDKNLNLVTDIKEKVDLKKFDKIRENLIDKEVKSSSKVRRDR